MRFAIGLLIAYSAFITLRYFSEPAKQEPVCIPLYAETGLECCE